MSTQIALEALQDAITGALPVRFTVTIDTATPAPGDVVVEAITPPQPIDLTLRGGDKLTMLAQVTIWGATRTDARLAGDRVRDTLTHKTRGRPTHVTAVGAVFDPIGVTADGYADTTQGIHTWAETYRVTWQPVAVIDS